MYIERIIRSNTYFSLLESFGFETFFFPSSGNMTPVNVHLAPLLRIMFPENIRQCIFHPSVTREVGCGHSLISVGRGMPIHGVLFSESCLEQGGGGGGGQSLKL